MPPKKGNALKWGLIGVAMLAIIGLTVVLTIALTKGDKGNGGSLGTTVAAGTTSPQGPASDIASANDTGPATIITEEPTCAAWIPISNTFADATTKAHWSGHDYTIPATEWSPEMREMYETVGKALAAAAEQAVALSKKTPHRVVRELYQQYIAYARTFANSLPSYTVNDNYLAGAAIHLSTALQAICDAINFQSAQAQAPFVPDLPAPTAVAEIGNLASPARFVTASDPNCAKWVELFDEFNSNSQAWGAMDSNVPATEWNSDQHEIVDAVKPIMVKYADDIEHLGRDYDNSVIADFATLSAQYWRAYVAALTAYTKSDFYLSSAAARPVAAITHACRALGV